MAKGSDVISHCNLIRTRVNGSGELITTLYDLGNTNSRLLTDATLAEGRGISLSQIANFRAERISVEIRVNQMDDWFKVSNLYAYVKQTAASFPQT